MQIRYLGHAAFLMEDGDTSILIDPFLSGNPKAPVRPEAVSPNYIIVTHGHDDHIGDTVAIARRTGATVVSTFEVANHLGSQGARVHAMHLGGKHRFPFGYLRCTPAYHGSGVPGGHAAGFVVHLHGKTVYHAGDTALFSDLKLLGELERIDVALLPIGDNFTMGPDDALLAAEWLRAGTVVPMHWGTFPLIDVDPHAFRAAAEAKGIAVQVLNPGDTLEA